MNYSDIPIHIDRGKDERRESLITEQLESGLLKFHPDLNKHKRVSNFKALIKERLQIALGFSEFDGSTRAFALTINRSFSFIYSCKKMYLNGELGEVDNEVVKKLNRGKK